MKVSKILEVYNGINTVMIKRLPVRAAFVLANNYEKLKAIVNTIEKQRIDIIGKYAEKDSDGNIKIDDVGNAVVPPVDMEELKKDLDELYNSEVSVDLDMIPIGTMERCDENGYDSLTPVELKDLRCMIDENVYAYDESGDKYEI